MARVLLIVGGGIAAYKSLELVRLLKKGGHSVTPVLTKGGEHFVTAMSHGTLAGKRILVTAGPTPQPIDPVRVIANRSSGRQGFAIAAATAVAGARVTLIVGPVALGTPAGVDRVDVETAEQMADAVMASLPADAAILVAAVADWRVEPSSAKLKKSAGPPALK